MKSFKNYLPLLGVAAVVTLLVVASYALIAASKKTVGEGKASATVTSTVTTDSSAVGGSIETVPEGRSASSDVKQSYELKHVSSNGKVTNSGVLKPDYYGSAEAMAIDSEGNPVFMFRRSLEDTKIVRSEDGVNKVVESCKKLCQMQGLASNSQGDFAYLVRDINAHLTVVLHTADGEVVTRTYCVQSDDGVQECVYKKDFPARELHSSTLAVTSTGTVFLTGKIRAEKDEGEAVYVADLYDRKEDPEYYDGDSIRAVFDYSPEYDGDPFKLATSTNNDLFVTSDDHIGHYKNLGSDGVENRYYFKPRISGFLKGMAVDRDDSVYLVDATESSATLQTFTPRGRLLEAVDLSDHFDLSQSRNLLLASGNDAGVYIAGPSMSLDSDV